MVYINGRNFEPNFPVLFDGYEINTDWISGGQIATHMVRAGTNAMEIYMDRGRFELRNSASVGGPATSSSEFVVLAPPPTITSLSATSGVAGDEVIITGTNLYVHAAVAAFNSFYTDGVSHDSDTQARVVVPAGLSGTTCPIRYETGGGVAFSEPFTIN